MPEPPFVPNSDPESTVVSTGPAAWMVIGPYHLLECIGRCGMGEVWLAEQKDPVRRRVALQLIQRALDACRNSRSYFYLVASHCVSCSELK